MTTGLERIATKALSDSKFQFNNLAHHLTEALLWESLKTIPLQSAVGVDQQAVEDARKEFQKWSPKCLSDIHNGGYRPPPVRRVYIPKPGKAEKRPIGVPTVIDRCLQRSTAKVLESIFEQDFLDCSYGGRPGRSAHHAVSYLKHTIQEKKISWVFEADLKNFFGSLDHTWLEKFVQDRVTDQRLLTLIRRWLKAGVMEHGVVSPSDRGTPQGGSISVVLSNIFLHYVLDLWFDRVVRPRLRGEAYLVRYLDDFVVCFQFYEDAGRFQTALKGRLAKFSLELEPSKTKLLEFGKFEKKASTQKDRKSPTFCFLGFRFFGFRLKWGYYTVATVVDGARRNRFIGRLKEKMRVMRHCTLKEQAKQTNAMLRGYFNYFAVPYGCKRLQPITRIAVRYWRKMLSSRSQSGRMTWKKFNVILNHYPLVRPKARYSLEDFRALGMS
jgi:group II intron reverse transcriptase/maturase